MPPKGHRSSQTRVSIKNFLSRKRRNGRESRTTRFNFPDQPDRVCDVVQTYRRCNFPFRKHAMRFGRDLEQFSLLSLSFANEEKNLI